MSRKEENGNLFDLPADYEECAECGMDHEYEYEHAHRWHSDNPGIASKFNSEPTIKAVRID